ncbi:hypothetical protein D0N36_06955 [Hymenobacter lapidiphilus]|uniref:hypothetical protein n=1 Tax=Hymenobacter sp. CCM 8763 TaxID=2303334 RepID=UPI000E354D50|nr:hypothetical protein [Hymenobacter sp. CCM 8763]RFP65937.1 hypothetical protein D0N36_06955 [Hymenobacter sp. CCM 8763]
MPESTIIASPKPRAPRSIDVKDYLKWGKDDQEPQRLHELVRSSGTATVCVATKAKFIEGNGLKDQTLWKTVINEKGQTVDELVRLHCLELAEGEGIQMLLNFNALGEPVEVLHLPFGQWRPGQPTERGEVQVVFEKRIPLPGKKKEKPIARLVYDATEPNEDRAERILNWEGGLDAYPGEIAYYFHRRPSAAGYHPEPVWLPVLLDIEVDALLKISRRTDVASGYTDKTMITEYGNANPTEEVKQANGVKYGGFVGPLGGRVLLQYAMTREQKPDVDTFQAPNASERYATDKAALKVSIREVFQIPDICYGESQAGKLGMDGEFEDATRYVQNMVVNTDQRAIETLYASVFSNFRTAEGEPVCPSGDYSIQNLSLNAQVEAAVPSEAEKTLQALNSLSPLVANKVLESMSADEIRALVGLKAGLGPDPSASTNGTPAT